MARMAAGSGRSGTNELDEADVMRFDVLPDDVLLHIFDCYCDNTSSDDKEVVEGWQALVHVCRRWRSLVFQSPRRLDLRLFCTSKTRTRDTLDIWPALPLIVDSGSMMYRPPGADNIFAALEESNRVRQVSLYSLVGRQLEQALALMQVPFPELTCLKFSTRRKGPPVIPDSFLGGSAPRLLHIFLFGISFPGLPNLLLSATHLVALELCCVPPSGYISPEAMVASLSALSNLKRLVLELRFFESRPDRGTRCPPPPKRSILPALEYFHIDGVTEYLDDLVALIDTPRLYSVNIISLYELDFGSKFQRLVQFINRTPKLRERDKAHLVFGGWHVHIQLDRFETLQISIPCRTRDQQLPVSSISWLGGFCWFSTVKDLFIECGVHRVYPANDIIVITLWLQLLLPFTTVKNLFIPDGFAPSIAAALRELDGSRVTEILPSLQKIFVKEPESFEKDIGQFVVARELSGHPVAISYWNKVF